MVVAKKDQEYIDRAFDLAYFIHASKGIAFCVAEEAWCKQEQALGKQDKRRYYRPGGRRKQEQPSQALRTKIGLREEHMLQCLVYAESDAWERCTEHGDSPYPLTEEDMIIRFIKHLVRLTVKRNSFYVTLGVGRLLYEYATSEVKHMYDVLVQDEARSKDNPYFRRQKRVLIRELLDRFPGMIRTLTTELKEERFLPQPATQQLINLVNECLRRFTPWDTTCVIPRRLDPAQVPAFSFSGTDPDGEASIETNRIHTILHPDCFSRFVTSLGFDPPHKRLAVPQFFYSVGGEPRGNRFHPPKLDEEDYLRLQRAREERARRRKVYLARRLRVYVDGVERACFDPRRTTRVELELGPGTDVIEVRGEDAQGELTLATLLVRCDELAPGESFEDWIVLEGGQKVTVRMAPIRDASGEIKGAHVEVRYAETQPIGAAVWLAQRAWFGLTERLKSPHEVSEGLRPGYAWLTKAGAAVALAAAALALIWFQLRPSPEGPSPQRVEQPRTKEKEALSPAPPPTPSVQPPAPKEFASLIARATWSVDPDAALQAMRIEPTRGEAARVDLSRPETMVLVRLPVDDEAGQSYSRYRVTLVSQGESLWQRTLRAPKPVATAREHLLSVTLFPQRVPKRDSYDLRVEARTQSRWQPIGRLRLNPMDR